MTATSSLHPRCDARPRARARRALLGVVLALVAVIGCESEPRAPWQGARRKGQIGVALQLGGDRVVRAVTYRISHANGFERSGTIPLFDESPDYSAWFGLPAADDYLLWLQATTSEGEVCEGMTHFDIRVDQKVSAQVVMECPEQARMAMGELYVTGKLNQCPVLESVVASAAQARVGQSIELIATATDSDTAPEPIEYSWTTGGGELSEPDAARTTLTCLREGDFQVSLAIADGDPACVTGLSFELECVSAQSEGTEHTMVVIPDASVDSEPPLPPASSDAGIGE